MKILGQKSLVESMMTEFKDRKDETPVVTVDGEKVPEDGDSKVPDEEGKDRPNKKITKK